MGPMCLFPPPLPSPRELVERSPVSASCPWKYSVFLGRQEKHDCLKHLSEGGCRVPPASTFCLPVRISARRRLSKEPLPHFLAPDEWLLLLLPTSRCLRAASALRFPLCSLASRVRSPLARPFHCLVRAYNKYLLNECISGAPQHGKAC